jgi:hypothetical protein
MSQVELRFKCPRLTLCVGAIGERESQHRCEGCDGQPSGCTNTDRAHTHHGVASSAARRADAKHYGHRITDLARG